jgi:hypothetical protein
MSIIVPHESGGIFVPVAARDYFYNESFMLQLKLKI